MKRTNLLKNRNRHNEIKNVNSLIVIKDIIAVITKCPQKKLSDLDNFTGEFYQAFMKNNTNITNH